MVQYQSISQNKRAIAILPEPKPEHKTQQTDKDTGEDVDLNLQVRFRKTRVEHKTEENGGGVPWKEKYQNITRERPDTEEKSKPEGSGT